MQLAINKKAPPLFSGDSAGLPGENRDPWPNFPHAVRIRN
jgi:hypothetical protein